MPRNRNLRPHPGSTTRGGRAGLRAVRSPSTEIAGLRGPYLTWLTDHGLPALTDPTALWDDTVAVVDLAVRHAGLRDLHAWTANQVHELSGALDDEDGGALAAL